MGVDRWKEQDEGVLFSPLRPPGHQWVPSRPSPRLPTMSAIEFSCGLLGKPLSQPRCRDKGHSLERLSKLQVPQLDRMGARSQFRGLCGWSEEGECVVGIRAQMTRGRFTANRVRLSPLAAFAHRSPLRLHRTRSDRDYEDGIVMFGWQSGEREYPSQWGGVSERVCMWWGMSLVLGTSPSERDNVARH